MRIRFYSLIVLAVLLFSVSNVSRVSMERRVPSEQLDYFEMSIEELMEVTIELPSVTATRT